MHKEMQRKHDVFDYNKLRRTVIKGLPCQFIDLPECTYLME